MDKYMAEPVNVYDEEKINYDEFDYDEFDRNIDYEYQQLVGESYKLICNGQFAKVA